MNPQKCVILVPVASHVEAECESALRELERRGYAVWRVPGYSAIDQARNQLATDALLAGFEETMWIDSDIKFHPDDVNRIQSHGLPICCAIYPKKGKRELAIHVIPGTETIVFGKEGGLQELQYAGTGFLHIRRPVYEAIREKLRIPECNKHFGKVMLPFFQPLIVPHRGGQWYLAEDFAFCERARQCGFKIMADTTIRLGHIGMYAYTWEEAGRETQRFHTYRFQLT
jgi:hypothetical protein